MTFQALPQQQTVEQLEETTELRLLSQDDSESFCQLFAEVFGKELPSHEWHWKYFENPDAPRGPYAAVADRGGELLGCYSLLPRTFYRGTQMFSSVTVVDNAIRRGKRNFSLQRQLKHLAVKHAAHDAQFGFGFPNDRAMQLGTKRLNYRSVGSLLAYRKVLGRWSALRDKWRKQVPDEEQNMSTAAVACCDREFDVFFQRVCQEFRPAMLIGRRDAQWLNWRFLAHPQQKYRLFAARRAGALCGYLVVTESQDNLEIVDCFHDSQSSTVASMLRFAEQQARDQRKKGLQIRFLNDALLFRELRRRGFRQETSLNLSVAAEMFSLNHTFATSLGKQWLLTPADSDVV